ncbi:MAG TPA: hypothetical protein VHN98_06410 [Acidimicrobiales bacterium]|nr:hypothetical protein [Acidimicrobiales bacterium]
MTRPSRPVAAAPARGLTIGQLWEWLTDGRVSDDLLAWPPDVAALTTVLLERSQAFRFVVSPPPGESWPPPERDAPFAEVVGRAADEWCTAVDSEDGAVPAVIERLWRTVMEHLDTAVADLACGRPWAVCDAVLTLHAIADEAAAGAVAGRRRPRTAGSHTARAFELLARTGSMARLPADRVAHLPKARTTPVGMTHRSLSRYSCATTDGVSAVWHRAPVRRPGTEPGARHANVLLLPWPLRIREADFMPVPGSVRRPEREPFGFFRYEPSEPLDLDLLDRLLDAALDEVDTVDAVVLPEGCVDEREVPALESRLARRGVALLVAGIRAVASRPDRFPGNGVHIGVLLGDRWWHYRQNKHHRWFLDGAQIEQYNIAGALHPGVRWWEAMDVPARSVHFLELGAGVTLAAVVCEDLARLDGVAELLRSVGPTLVMTLLLDGPQLASRWTARYAGVLADDPGSAVLTLTALGMATRSRPRGASPSRVVAMWKDPIRGVREIPLEEGAQGVLLTAVVGRSSRYAADGRAPADDATDLYVAGVHQLRAAPPKPDHGGVAGGASSPSSPDASSSSPDAPSPAPLDADELTILWSWAEAVVGTIATGGDDRVPGDAAVLDRVERVLVQADAGAPWRAVMGVPEPSPPLAEAIRELRRRVTDALGASPALDADAVLAELGAASRSLVDRILRAAVDAAGAR